MKEANFHPNIQENKEIYKNKSDEITVDEVLDILKDDDYSKIKAVLDYEKEYYPESAENEKPEIIISGALFEILNDKEQKRDEKVASVIKEQLMDVISEPKGDFAKTLRKYRKPDLIDISYSQEERKYIINSVTEITHGKLDKRKGEQILSLQEDMNKILDILRENLKQSEMKRYEDLAIVIDSIDVSDGLALNLILSKDKENMSEDSLFTMPDNTKSKVQEKISSGAVNIEYSKYSKDVLMETANKIAPLFF